MGGIALPSWNCIQTLTMEFRIDLTFHHCLACIHFSFIWQRLLGWAGYQSLPELPWWSQNGVGEDEDKEFRSLSHGLPFRTNMFVGVLEVAGCFKSGWVPLADGFKCEEVILWCEPRAATDIMHACMPACMYIQKFIHIYKQCTHTHIHSTCCLSRDQPCPLAVFLFFTPHASLVDNL